MAVPNTNTFSLQDVVNEINPPSDTLQSCFDNASSAQFDITYEGLKDRLSNFRNYGNAALPPSVITLSATYDALTQIALLRGEVTNENNASVTATGFWYRLNDPNVGTDANSTQVTSTDTGLGVFTANKSIKKGLTAVMYIRAYATNSAGTTHASNVVSVPLS